MRMRTRTLVDAMTKKLLSAFLAAVALLLVYCLFSIKFSLMGKHPSSVRGKQGSGRGGVRMISVTDAPIYVATDTLNMDRSSHVLQQDGHIFINSLSQSSVDSSTNVSTTTVTYHQSTTESPSHSANTMQQSLRYSTTTSSMWNSHCNDPLCTEYLSTLDLTNFRLCSRHLQKSHDNQIDNGTCRFINGTARRNVALFSFPGSGNTWVRGLLESATGICTGSVYCDQSLRVTGFNGEGVSSSAVLAVKTHQSIRPFQAIIHIMRCPGDAIVSEWNRKHGTSSGKSKHTALASPQTFGYNKEWDAFVHEWSRRWGLGVLKMARYQQKYPLLRVFYEDLKTNTTHEVIRMLDFLEVPSYLSTHLQNRLNSRLQKFHRQREDFKYFTEQQKEALRSMLLHVIGELAAGGYTDSVEYVQQYLSICTMS